MTTPFKIDIDAESVNRAISEAVLQSAIGQQMQRAINEHVTKLKQDYTFSRQIDQFVEKAISDEIKRQMETHRPTIAAFVTEKVTDDLLKKIIDTMWQKWDRGY